jgi:hypothetical protein
MAGIFHSYYTVVLAPGVAALVATGSWLAWERRHEPWVRLRLSIAVLSTVSLAAGTVLVVGHDLRWAAGPILASGVVAGLVLHPRSGPSRLRLMTGMAALSVCLAGPALFVAATVQLPHVGSGPMAGPGNGASTTALVAVGTGRVPGLWSFGSDRPLTPRVVSTLGVDSEKYRWAAAAMGARSAAAYQLAIDEPVLAIGGYKGTDPLPTLSQFQTMVRAGHVHWFIPGGIEGLAGHAIATWVSSRFSQVVVDGFSLYDLSGPVSTSSSTSTVS